MFSIVVNESYVTLHSYMSLVNKSLIFFLYKQLLFIRKVYQLI